MDEEQFFREIWEFVGSHPAIFPKSLIKDLYEIGWEMRKEKPGQRVYYCLCWCVRDLMKHYKGRMPDSIHSRMVLGPQNEKTREYANAVKKIEEMENAMLAVRAEFNSF